MDRPAREADKGQEMPMASVLGDLHDGQTVTDIPTSKSRRVLLKIDLVVMPLIVISMTLAFLDKVCLFSDPLPSGKINADPFQERSRLCSYLRPPNRHSASRPAI
jgi:hypothetical protein